MSLMNSLQNHLLIKIINSSPMSPPNSLPFQDHPPSIPPLPKKSSIHRNLNSNHAVSPCAGIRQQCQYICLI